MSYPYIIKTVAYKEVAGEILNLWRDNGYSGREKILEWLYGEYESRPPMSSAFLTLNYNNNIVGCCGVIERKMQLADKTGKAAYPNNFLVDSRHRSLGPAMQVQKNILNLKEYQLIYAIPNDKSVGVLKRVGYEPIGKMERWVLVLKTEKYLKKFFKYSVFAKFFAVLADIFLNTIYAFKGIHIVKINPEIIDNFDERFNQLWDKASKNYVIIGDRSSEYLKWRFKDYPAIDYKIFTLRDSDKNLKSYLVFYELKEGYYIEDLFTETGEMCVNLLRQFLKYAKKHHRDSISIRFFGDRAIFNSLEKVGFKKRSDSNFVLIFSGKKNKNIYDKNNWFLTAADMDV